MPEHLRTWRLLRLGVSIADQETAPAVTLDWLLAIDAEWQEAKADAERKASEGANRG